MWPDGWIIFQYLAIYINENLPNDIQNVTKSTQKNAKHKIGFQKLPIF